MFQVQVDHGSPILFDSEGDAFGSSAGAGERPVFGPDNPFGDRRLHHQNTLAGKTFLH